MILQVEGPWLHPWILPGQNFELFTAWRRARCTTLGGRCGGGGVFGFSYGVGLGFWAPQSQPPRGNKAIIWIQTSYDLLRKWWASFLVVVWHDTSPATWRYCQGYKKVVNKSSFVPKWATKKIPSTFHYTGWLIGILIKAYYNPHITW